MEVAMSFTRSLNIIIVCAAFGFIAAVALGIMP